jgi:hypothetical protein
MSRNMYPLDRLHVIIATCNMTLKSDCEISILLRQSCVLIGSLTHRCACSAHCFCRRSLCVFSPLTWFCRRSFCVFSPLTWFCRRSLCVFRPRNSSLSDLNSVCSNPRAVWSHRNVQIDRDKNTKLALTIFPITDSISNQGLLMVAGGMNKDGDVVRRRIDGRKVLFLG